jgi:ABC-type uncharacterized transport system permease subunit
MEFLTGISVTCFVGSYLVALVLECTRPLWRVPARYAVTIGFTSAGLFAHAFYLVFLANPENRGRADMGLLADWYSWSLLLAWAVAVVYWVLLIRKPETTVGYFLLPTVLVLVALALAVRGRQPFSREQAAGLWSSIHGLTMLLGAAGVVIGFLAGGMYLVQSARLKRKRSGGKGLKLPSLEWLQRVNRGTLIFSTAAVAVGTIAGVIMNLNAQGSVPWTSRDIVLPVVLLVWLLAATAMELLYKPARQGRKVAYLTLASFGFLVLAMAGVLGTEHGGGTASSKANGSAAGAREVPR